MFNINIQTIMYLCFSPINTECFFDLKYSESANNKNVITVARYIKENPVRSVSKNMYFLKHNSICIIEFINMITPQEIVELYNEFYFLENYWSEEILNSLIDKNLFRLHNHTADCEFFSQLIDITNYVNKNYNFINTVFNKRMASISNIDSDIDTNINIDDYVWGENTIISVCSNKNWFNKDFDIVAYPLINRIDSTKNILMNGEWLIYKNIKIFKTVLDIKKIFIEHNQNIVYYKNRFYATLKGYQRLKDHNLNRTELVDCYSYEWDSFKFKQCSLFNVKNINRCYICKGFYDPDIIVDWYNCMCWNCALLNYDNRNINIDIKDQVAVVTGIRANIGYCVALKLLRSGAKVIGTSRFPNLTHYNFSLQKDYDEWKTNLIVFKVDFLKIDEINSFVNFCKDFKPNIIVNNACQTVRMSKTSLIKTVQFEEIIRDSIGYIDKNEITEIIKTGTNGTIVSYEPGVYKTIDKKMIDYGKIYDETKVNGIELNSFLKIKDEQYTNSWTQELGQIDPVEILEANIINQIVPTLLVNSLLPIMNNQKFIINVVAFEGQFQCKKNAYHAHTNMCKTALIMMIRTLKESSDANLHCFAVNPGFISGVNPQHENFPLKPEDGATRILYPVLKFYSGDPIPKSWTKIDNFEEAKW